MHCLLDDADMTEAFIGQFPVRIEVLNIFGIVIFERVIEIDAADIALPAYLFPGTIRYTDATGKTDTQYVELSK